jgi:hypothetical protein
MHTLRNICITAAFLTAGSSLAMGQSGGVGFCGPGYIVGTSGGCFNTAQGYTTGVPGNILNCNSTFVCSDNYPGCFPGIPMMISINANWSCREDQPLGIVDTDTPLGGIGASGSASIQAFGPISLFVLGFNQMTCAGYFSGQTGIIATAC